MSEFQFDPGQLSVIEAQRIVDEMWASIAFDAPALRRLKQDGLVLENIRLTGPSPFILKTARSGAITMTISTKLVERGNFDTLLALWQLHFLKGLRWHNNTA